MPTNQHQGADTDAETVLETVHTIMHLYRARQFRALRDGPHDVTHMESKVLGFFARRPGANQSDLMVHSGRDKAQLARLVRGLRDKGLLEARADEGDRRSTRLQLTEAGQALYASLHAAGAELSREALAGMSEGECRQLAQLLEKVRVNLDADE